MIKLPIFAVVRETYAFVWRERRLFWALAVPGIIVLSLLTGVMGSLNWILLGKPEDFSQVMIASMRLGIDQEADWALSLALLTVALLIQVAIIIIYMVAWHRAYLMPAEVLSPRSAYRWQRRQTRFIGNYVKLFLILGPAFILLSAVATFALVLSESLLQSPGPQRGLWIVAATLLGQGFSWMVICFLFARLSLVFPAAAIDKPLSLRQGWRLSRGNGWRLFWAVGLVTLPFSLLLLLQFVLGIVLWESGLGGSLTANLLAGLFYQVWAFIGLALGVSVLSISYRRLTATA